MAATPSSGEGATPPAGGADTLARPDGAVDPLGLFSSSPEISGMMRFMKPSKSGTVKAVSPCDGPGHRPAFWAGFVFLGLLRRISGANRRLGGARDASKRFASMCGARTANRAKRLIFVEVANSATTLAARGAPRSRLFADFASTRGGQLRHAIFGVFDVVLEQIACGRNPQQPSHVHRAIRAGCRLDSLGSEAFVPEPPRGPGRPPAGPTRAAPRQRRSAVDRRPAGNDQ